MADIKKILEVAFKVGSKVFHYGKKIIKSINKGKHDAKKKKYKDAVRDRDVDRARDSFWDE